MPRSNQDTPTITNLLPPASTSFHQLPPALALPPRSVKAAVRADAEHHGRDSLEAARHWEAQKAARAGPESIRTEQRSHPAKRSDRGIRGIRWIFVAFLLGIFGNLWEFEYF